MKALVEEIKYRAASAFSELYPTTAVSINDILVNDTKPEFKGDYTIVLFPFVKSLKSSPQDLGKSIGDWLLKEHGDFIEDYEVVAGFLNLTLRDRYLMGFLADKEWATRHGARPSDGRKVMIEYSSPNTNKPLHFGHLRNIFLGWSVAELLKAAGHQVIKTNLINDRGIHICKSMVAWMRYANGATPESTNIKGDHLVGDYYVAFNDYYKQEVAALMEQGQDAKSAETNAPIFKEAQELLRKWEAGDTSVYQLWEQMNAWVYKGFAETYAALGIDFDKVYYESQTYLLGREIVLDGLKRGVLFKKEDGSVWIDLKAEGLDEKLLLRADGTSVYMTQDLGTARLKHEDFELDQSVYVIADEQNYHMQVLKKVLEHLGEPCAPGIFHLSYGMVELPHGRMKSREGTVVDADDMVKEMIALAKEQTLQAGKTDGFTDSELEQLYKTIGLGALKFYLLRVEPKKKMIFDPKESIDLHGFTATFIQYAHARICSILRKHPMPAEAFDLTAPLEGLERSMLLQMEQFPAVVEGAASSMNPSIICNYTFRLAQTFNSFYDKHSIVRAETEEKKHLRLIIAASASQVLRKGMALLGIDVPEKM